MSFCTASTKNYASTIELSPRDHQRQDTIFGGKFKLGHDATSKGPTSHCKRADVMPFSSFNQFFLLFSAISQAWVDGFGQSKCLYPHFRRCLFQWYRDLWAISMLNALNQTPKSTLWKPGIANKARLFLTQCAITWCLQGSINSRQTIGHRLIKLL